MITLLGLPRNSWLLLVNGATVSLIMKWTFELQPRWVFAPWRASCSWMVKNKKAKIRLSQHLSLRVPWQALRSLTEGKMWISLFVFNLQIVLIWRLLLEVYSLECKGNLTTPLSNALALCGLFYNDFLKKSLMSFFSFIKSYSRIYIIWPDS